MLINDATKIAQYDTGAEGNFMSKTLAKKYKLLVQRSRNQQGSFAIANGKRIKSSGQAEAWCTFALDPGRKMKCVFQIWDKLAGGDLIMGRAFLSETRTLSSFRHRLRERISSLSLPTINFIGSTTTDSCCRFACNIDGRPTHINADTGSDLDVISLRYARAQRYEINTEERKLVRLGDASVVGTYGQVEAEVDVGGYKYWKVFDVLPDLTSDVVLGELTLEEVEAYTRFETSFTDINLGKRNFEMNIMITIGKIGNLIRPRRQLNSTATYRELSSTSLFLHIHA